MWRGQQWSDHMQRHTKCFSASSLTVRGWWPTAAQCRATWSAGSASLVCRRSGPSGLRNQAPRLSPPHIQPRRKCQGCSGAESKMCSTFFFLFLDNFNQLMLSFLSQNVSERTTFSGDKHYLNKTNKKVTGQTLATMYRTILQHLPLKVRIW